MNWIALRMLMGDRTKYLGLIFGVAFATLLMTQQVSVFMGIMQRTANQVLDIRDASIWVMDRRVRFVDEVPSLPTRDLFRVRGIEGVDWAVPLFKGQVQARLGDGDFRNLIIFGLDDSTMVGAPEKMLQGRLSDLRKPDSVIIDKAGHEYMWPGQPVEIGREFMINNQRLVLVGVCQALAPFTTMPVLYTRFSTTANLFPHEPRVCSFVMVSPKPGEDPSRLCARIETQTGLMALTRDQFFWRTINYFMGSTGIPVNFGITILLGFIVGAAVTGQTFYLFTIENLRQFGAVKAMGATNAKIIRMILLQGLVIGSIGFGIGIGLSAIFFISTSQLTHLAGIHLTWVSVLGTGLAVFLIILVTALVSIRKVLVLEPAIVFRG